MTKEQILEEIQRIRAELDALSEEVECIISEQNKKGIKIRFIEYVMLTEDEYKKLIERYGAGVCQLYVNKLNDYIGQIGVQKAKKYKSHYHTILNWIRRDREKQIAKQETPKQREYRIIMGKKQFTESNIQDKIGALDFC